MELGQERPDDPFSAMPRPVFLPAPFHKPLEKTADGGGWVLGMSAWACWELEVWLAPELGETCWCFQAAGIALCS